MPETSEPKPAASARSPWSARAATEAAAQGAQIMCFQELFYGPYFCQVQDAQYYEYTEEFCAKYDQTAFDPDYTSPPLEHYHPLIRTFFVPDGVPGSVPG